MDHYELPTPLQFAILNAHIYITFGLFKQACYLFWVWIKEHEREHREGGLGEPRVRRGGR